MVKPSSFTKRAMISKANSRMVVTTSVAVFIVVFCLIASKTLVSDASYQNKVISSDHTALSTLKTDLSARDALVTAYNSFVSTPQNVIGGNPSGDGPNDGNNADIVLDALPNYYDFPALTTTIEKLVESQGLTINDITGTDEALSESNQPTGTPQAVPMPFEVAVSGSYANVENLITTLERSIRPFQVQKISLSGDESNMQAVIDAQTFYQPPKTLNISQEVVR